MKYPFYQLALFTLLLISPVTLFAYDTFKVAVSDTLVYNLPSGKNQYWQVKGAQTNVVVALYKNGKLAKVQDESKGINSVERVWVEQEKKSTYQLKVWANMFLKEFRAYDVEINPMPDWKPLPTVINAQSLHEDLQAYIAIKRDAHIGTYLYRTEQYMDSVYNELAKSIDQKEISIIDFYKNIARLSGLEGSCHNFTRLPNHLPYYFPLGDHYIPLTVKYNNGHLLHMSSESDLPKGAVILSINDIPAKSIIDNLTQLITTDGFSQPYKYVGAFTRNWLNYYHIHYGIASQYKIHYEWQGKRFTTHLKGISYEQAISAQEKQNNKPDSPRYSFNRLEHNLYLLKITGFDFAGSKEDPAYALFEDFLETMMDTLEKNPGASLVTDLRGNMGGAGVLYEKTFTYLADRAFRDSDFAFSQFNNLLHTQYFNLDEIFISNHLTTIEAGNNVLTERFPKGVAGRYYLADHHNPLILPNKRTFKGQQYLLINSYVASAAAHLASLIKSYTNAIVIGEETMGGYYEHVGHLPFSYTLPNSHVQIGFSVVYVKQDADILPDQDPGSGVKPHHQLLLSHEEAISETDFHLEKVRELFMRR